MRKKGYFKHFDFFIIGVVCLICTFFLSNCIRQLPEVVLSSEIYKLLFTYEMLSYVVINYFYNPYEDILKRNNFSICYGIVIFGFLQLALISVLLFAIKEGASISRLYVALQYVIFVVITCLVDILYINSLKRKVKNFKGTNGVRVLVVTEPDRLEGCIKDITVSNYEFYDIVGLCLFGDNSIEEYKGYKVLCHEDDLLSYVCANWVDSVYFELRYDKVPNEILNGLATMGVTTHLRLSKVKALIGQDQNVENFLGEPVLTSCVKERTNKQIFRKGMMDFIGGIIGSLITIILTIFIGPIIKIKSPKGPIFYKQERIGLNGRHFYMYKFRSMIPDAEAHLKELETQNRVKDGMMFKVENDPRIIPGIGNFIRKTSLDEFPQFFNVLKGDMSLVGTRPPTVNEWEKYDLRHRIRMSIKPGITGMWQVSGRNEITDFEEVVRLDSEYIKNWHIGLDIKIILKTIKVIFVRKSKNEVM